MLLKIVLGAVILSTSSIYAQTVNPQFFQYQDNVFKELNKDPNVRAQYEKVKQLETKYANSIRGLDAESVRMAASSANPQKSMFADDYNQWKESVAISKELGNARDALNADIAKSGGHQIYTHSYDFAEGIANDLKTTSGPKVVGFLAGFSSAGHDAKVVDNLNTMQKAAAEYFGLKANSSYGLINGASMDGGINERFEEAVKDGKFKPAVDPKNFKSYGAVSVNIGEWGGMMTTNKSVLLADSPAGNYEMKANPQSSSLNPLALTQAATIAGANVHVMLNEGGEIGLKEVLEYINNQHKPGQKALIHLGIGYDPTNPSKDKGIRGASFLARHLALHPELIDSLEKSGVKFMAVDATSGRHYSSIKEYLKSPDWKTQLLKFSKAGTELNSKEFEAKKKLIAELEEKVKSETNKDKKKALNNQIGTLKGEIALTENRVNSETKIAEYVGELSKIKGYQSGSGALERVAKASGSAIEATRRSGATVDPAAAAKEAVKGVK